MPILFPTKTIDMEQLVASIDGNFTAATLSGTVKDISGWNQLTLAFDYTHQAAIASLTMYVGISIFGDLADYREVEENVSAGVVNVDPAGRPYVYNVSGLTATNRYRWRQNIPVVLPEGLSEGDDVIHISVTADATSASALLKITPIVSSQ